MDDVAAAGGVVDEVVSVDKRGHILFMEDLQQHWSLYRVIRDQHVHGLRNNDELQATLRPLLDAIHATGHAFGDFRPPIIMVRLRKHEDAGEARFTAVDLKLVDFELCGAVGSPWPRGLELNPEVFDMSKERERCHHGDAGNDVADVCWCAVIHTVFFQVCQRGSTRSFGTKLDTHLSLQLHNC